MQRLVFLSFIKKQSVQMTGRKAKLIWRKSLISLTKNMLMCSLSNTQRVISNNKLQSHLELPHRTEYPTFDIIHRTTTWTSGSNPLFIRLVQFRLSNKFYISVTHCHVDPDCLDRFQRKFHNFKNLKETTICKPKHEIQDDIMILVQVVSTQNKHRRIHIILTFRWKSFSWGRGIPTFIYYIPAYINA